MIEVAIETLRPRLDIRVPADKDALPIVRQALRTLGQSADADAGALHDAELALTEACANVVKHAYGEHEGNIDVTIEVRTTDVLMIVRDSGCGIDQHKRSSPRAVGGLGLALIEAITPGSEVRSLRGEGTEVVMAVPLDGDGRALPSSPPIGSAVTRVVRRLVAMTAAQTDLGPERITEALLATEIVARHAPDQLVGSTVHLRLERLDGGVELTIGPFADTGTDTLLNNADIPALGGSVVERLADEVWTVRATPERADAGEELALRFAA